MDTKDLEVRTSRSGHISYWKDGVLIGKRCTKCGKDKEISEFLETKNLNLHLLKYRITI